MITPERLHYFLTRYVIERGHAPEPGHLSETGWCSEEQYAEALSRLEQMHGVILEPRSKRIWSLHPFSMIPTTFWVSARDRGWWANCAWCALAIGVATEEDTEISTSDGGEGDPLVFKIRNGECSRPELLMHFPYPPAQWWDNPYNPCGNNLFFSSEALVDAWCARHDRPKGSVLPIESGMQLTQRWFGDYASPAWRRKSAQEAQAIFNEIGLDAAFWNIDGSFR